MTSAQQIPTNVAPATARRRRPPRAPWRVWLVALAIGTVVGVLAFLVMPNKGPGPVELEGDSALAGRVTEALAGKENQVQGLSVTEVDKEESTSVRGGTTDRESPITGSTPFETGSVFKVFTAMTLADMVEHGETSLDRKLGDVFTDIEFADPRVADITLEELATHQSGLPRQPPGSGMGSTFSAVTASDPWDDMPPVEHALAETRQGPTHGEWAYSNFGFSVLGAALAREAGTDYPALVHQRVLDPVGMDDTTILGADTGTGAAPDGAALPHLEAGARTEPWNAVDYAPAGIGTWTTTDDLERFLRAVMDGSAPGMSAVRPAHEGPNAKTRLGLGWMVTDLGGKGTVTQHTGATYGTQTYIGLRDDTAIVVLSNSGMVDPAIIGARAMGTSTTVNIADDGAAGLPPAVGLGVTLPMVLLPVLLAVTLMVRRRTLVGQRPLDRLRIVSMPLGAAATLVAAQRTGSWVYTPAPLWGVAAGAVAAAAVVGVWYWPRVRTESGRWRWLHVAFFTLSVLASMTLGAVMTWGLVVSNT